MLSLVEFLKKSLENDEPYLVEGLYLDYKTKTVKLTDSTKGVDFNGPTEYEENGIAIISIFKRTPHPYKDEDDKDQDGNPFIYALKEKKKWKFDITNEEITKYCQKFVSNCEKLDKTFDTIVMIPSTSKINERFMRAISNYVKSSHNITDLFQKQELDKRDPTAIVNFKQLEEETPNKDKYDRAVRKINTALMKQVFKYKNVYFSAKDFPKEYLKYVKSLCKTDKDYSEELTDKDVLILDDTYSSGETISQAVDAIKANYNPKSITAITLLSKKFKQ